MDLGLEKAGFKILLHAKLTMLVERQLKVISLIWLYRRYSRVLIIVEIEFRNEDQENRIPKWIGREAPQV